MKSILIAIFLMVLGPAMFWLDSDLASDFGMRGQTLVPANIATSDRRCRSTFFILNQCSFKYEHNGEQHGKNYVIFSLGAPETVSLLQSTETGELTSTVGQEYFWNRIVALLFFNGISLFVAIASFASLLGGRSSGQAHQQLHRAVPVAPAAPAAPTAPVAPAGVQGGLNAHAFAPNPTSGGFGKRPGGTFGQR